MFNEDDKKIFGPYLNGQGTQVFADPLRALRRLFQRLDGDPNTVLKQRTSDNEMERLAAEERLVPAIVVALDLTLMDPTTGQGLTETQALNLLDQFLDFIAKKSTPDANLPTSSPPSMSRPQEWHGIL